MKTQTAKHVLSAQHARNHLKKLATPKSAQSTKSFFKTGEGGYSADDQFIGVSAPQLRALAKEFHFLTLGEIKILLQSKIHEERALALIILVNRIKKAEPQEQKLITEFYLDNLTHVNNWDLVDISAEWLLGYYLYTQTTQRHTQETLSAFAHSPNLWFRRVSILATFYFIRRNEFALTFTISKILLKDEQDLIHKAVGWLIREVGKRDLKAEEAFLKIHYSRMPRTMLRYAIEKFPEKKRLNYLKGVV